MCLSHSFMHSAWKLCLPLFSEHVPRVAWQHYDLRLRGVLCQTDVALPLRFEGQRIVLQGKQLVNQLLSIRRVIGYFVDFLLLEVFDSVVVRNHADDDEDRDEEEGLELDKVAVDQHHQHGRKE